MAAAYPRPQVVPSDIGQPVSFSSGLFAGRTIRVELEEIQKADLGRKYARKDKRPLDPPPVVICRFYNVVDKGRGRVTEQEIDPEQVAIGAICHVDLFPVPSRYEPESKLELHAHGSVLSADPSSALPPIRTGLVGPHPSMPPAGMHHPAAAPVPHLRQSAITLPPVQAPPLAHAHMQAPVAGAYTQPALPTYGAPLHAGGVAPMPGLPPVLPGFQDLALVHPQAAAAAAGYVSPHEGDIAAWYGSFAIREDSKCTTMLSGATFMQCSVLDYRGRKAAMFVFSVRVLPLPLPLPLAHDLAVKMEGTFVLRYRTLNVFSQRSAPPYVPVLAECFGGPFKIYSTKDFPGLRASTALTKARLPHLALYGVRVNLRESERKRRKKDGPTTTGERDRDDGDGDGDGDDPMHSGTEAAHAGAPSSPVQFYSPTSPYMSSAVFAGAGARRASTSSGAASGSVVGRKREPSPDEFSPWEERSDG
ncbi:hypothetical protein OH77DRAFT_1523819 [Trametes cingulata]|nr:hypothetical protein OH77DRAFT_1523819 [Trametes cingulata]